MQIKLMRNCLMQKCIFDWPSKIMNSVFVSLESTKENYMFQHMQNSKLMFDQLARKRDTLPFFLSILHMLSRQKKLKRCLVEWSTIPHIHTTQWQHCPGKSPPSANWTPFHAAKCEHLLPNFTWNAAIGTIDPYWYAISSNSIWHPHHQFQK